MNKTYIVMDIDGTLTNSKKEITLRTKRVLLDAQKQGGKLILASGRPLHGLLHLAKELKMDQYQGILIAFNGAEVYSYPDLKLLHQHAVPDKFKRPIINNARALNLSIMIHDHADVVSEREGYMSAFEASLCHMNVHMVNDLIEYVETFSPSKFLVSAPSAYLKQQYEAFRLPFGSMLSICTSAPFYIEITDIGVDKGNALREVCKLLHISHEAIIAFGDEMNDLTMLQFAGYGVAMGNAVKPIKLIADYVTLSNDEDGIAHVLEKLI